jgi:hypothetical protein
MRPHPQPLAARIVDALLEDLAQRLNIRSPEWNRPLLREPWTALVAHALAQAHTLNHDSPSEGSGRGGQLNEYICASLARRGSSETPGYGPGHRVLAAR